MRISRGFAECCVGGPGRADQHRDRAPHHRKTAAERREALEERAEGRAGASEGINTRSHTGFFSDPEPFTGGRKAQSAAEECSNEPRRCRPPQWVL